jgi:hypothetical protein
MFEEPKTYENFNYKHSMPKPEPKLVEDKNARIKSTLSVLANTEDGLYFLKWLCQFTSFQDNVISVSQIGEINPMAVIYNEGRRNLWVSIRAFLTPEDRNKAEMNEV